MIALHAWPGGLAVAVEGAAHRTVAVFGADGWRRGEPRVILPDGPPAGAQMTVLEVPSWLADQLALLDMTLGGAHTDFVRLDRLVARLQAQGASGAVVVLGARPAVIVATEGRLRALTPPIPADADVVPAVTGARGWILVFSGSVVVPAEAVERHAAAPAPQPMPLAPASHLEPAPAPAAYQAGAPQPAPATVHPTAVIGPSTEGRFVLAPRVAQAPPEDLIAEIAATAGDGAMAALAHLDGSRTLAEVAQTTGLSHEQVAAVVRVLVARRLAFRYVSRPRPPTGVRTHR